MSREGSTDCNVIGGAAGGASVKLQKTQPSLGVGYELGRAVEMNKRVICFFRPSARSSMYRPTQRVKSRAFWRNIYQQLMMSIFQRIITDKYNSYMLLLCFQKASRTVGGLSLSKM